jgi:hypothetical protein
MKTLAASELWKFDPMVGPSAEQLADMRKLSPDHIMLDDQGELGELVLHPNSRSTVLMHGHKWWCITGLVLEGWPAGVPYDGGVRIISGLYDVVTVRYQEIVVAGTWPTFVIGPPKQNLGVSAPSRWTGTPASVRVRVSWRLATPEERARFPRLRE